MDEPLLFEIDKKVATLTINRERRRNALDDATLFKMRDALEAAKRERLIDGTNQIQKMLIGRHLDRYGSPIGDAADVDI